MGKTSEKHPSGANTLLKKITVGTGAFLVFSEAVIGGIQVGTHTTQDGWNPFGESSYGFTLSQSGNEFSPIDTDYYVNASPTVSLNGFLAVLHTQHSPISDETARAIYSMMLQKHINPAYFLAVGQEETGLGKNEIMFTDDQGKDIDSLDICNMRPWKNIDLSVLRVIHTDNGDFVGFDSFGNVPTSQNGGHDGYWHAADAWSNAVTYWVSQGDVTVAQVANVMTPNTPGYVDGIEADMKYYYTISEQIRDGMRGLNGNPILYVSSDPNFNGLRRNDGFV